MEHSTSTTRAITKKDMRMTSYVAGLISFAELNPDFGDQLALTVKEQNWNTNTAISVPETVTNLTPTSTEHATSVAHWVFSILNESSECSQARCVLTTWAANRDLPKNLFIGIIGMAIMGPTLGIVESTKKKKKAQLQIVVTDSFFTNITKSELTKLTARLSQEIFAHEIKLAGGDVFKLHPDTAEWYLGEPELKLYTVDQETIMEMDTVTKSESLFTCAEYKNNQLQALAISPSINDGLVEDLNATLI